MKKSGLLNPELLAAIGELGHTDEFIVCDGGYPIPDGLSHDGLKDRGYGARFAVRPGEFTPYFNVIVISGVPF